MTVNEQGSSETRVASRERRAMRRVLLTLLVTVLVIAALALSAPWLRATMGAPMMYVVSATVTLSMLGYLALFEVRQVREMDEVLRASQQFAGRWGASAGQVAFVLLMFLPPCQQLAVALVTSIARNAPTGADNTTVILIAMFLGFAFLKVLEAIATMVFGVIWWKRSQST